MNTNLPNVKPALRAFLRRILPPRAFELVRSGWWRVSFHFPRLTASWFVKPRPAVRAFGAGGAPHLMQHLGGVNALAPTDMCRVMTLCGSDKGHRWHNYTTVYSALFKPYRDRPVRILELGIGTNNPEVPCHMPGHGRPGASLRGWRELFPRALVFGADIDRCVLFQEDRIKTFYCDQLDCASIRELWSQPDLLDGADIIIEDGLHTFEANVSFLEGSLAHLRPGGIYVIEDIAREAAGRWYHRLETIYSKRYPADEFTFVDLPNRHNSTDNNLLVVRRGGAGAPSSQRGESLV